MGRFWSCCMALATASLLLIAVPIHYTPDNEAQLKSQFEEYVRNFNKSYRNDPAEYNKRFHNFRESMKDAQLLNMASPGSLEHKARFGPTAFSDMSREEFAQIHLSDEIAQADQLTRSPSSNEVYERRKRAAVPDKFDWRDKGYVGAVLNQGLCGACWAFSTIGAMETMAAIKTGRLEPLSVQEMIDCAGGGNRGCSGGDICLLLAWLRGARVAVRAAAEYPLSTAPTVCHGNTSAGVQLTGSSCGSYVGREEEIVSMLATHGPVAAAVNALTWQHYIGGVIQHHCGGTILELNHAVQIIGYDLTAEVPHFIARNSWGLEFGESDYVRLAIGQNICGLANEVASVDVQL